MSPSARLTATEVRNRAFTPGPHSTSRKYSVIAFVEWYLERMGARAPRD